MGWGWLSFLNFPPKSEGRSEVFVKSKGLVK